MKYYEIRSNNVTEVEIFFQRNIPNYLFVKVAKTVVTATEAITYTNGRIIYDSFLIDNTGLILFFHISNKKGLIQVKKLATKLNKIYEITKKDFNCIPF